MLTLAVLIGIFVSMGMLAFSGAFDTKFSREELTASFIQNKVAFQDVTNYFKTNIPTNIPYTVMLSLSSRNRVSLYLYPIVISPENKIIGEEDVSVSSPKLDSALAILKWSSATLLAVRTKLSKTNCDWIRTVDYNDQIKMAPTQNSWGTFTYSIWSTPITDSLVTRYGEPIEKKGFGKYVTLGYTSAL